MTTAPARVPPTAESGPGEPFDAAVIMATILRPTLLKAVRSVFAQDLKGRIQILIGIDKRAGDAGVLDRLRAECPSHITMTLCDPGYSTAAPNGGVYSALTGGGLLAGLSMLAGSRYLCYLDDDNWYAPEHLSSLRRSIDGVGWAHSWRWFVNSYDDRPIEIDRWHAVGPNAGLYAPTMGGLVDTNTYMIDRARCADMLWRWSHALQEKGAGNDRGVFAALVRKEAWRCTEQATVYYRIPPEREWVIHHWKWKGTPDLPDTRETSFSILHSGLGKVLPMPAAATGGGAREAAAPVEVCAVIDTTMSHTRPRTVIDIGSGDGDRVRQIGRAARAAGVAVEIIAVDDWLPQPMDDDDRPRPLVAPGAAHARFCAGVRADGLEGTVVALPVAPRRAARLFRNVRARARMLTIDGRRGDVESLLRWWWPVLHDNGLVLIQTAAADGDMLHELLMPISSARNARIGWVGDDPYRFLAVRKPPAAAGPPSSPTAP